MSFDWGGFGAGLLQGVERGLIIGDKINDAVRKGRFKNSVDKANKDQETATAELNDERNRRAAAVADLEASKPGESLKETPEMAIPNMRFGESQSGGLQVPKQQTAIPVSSFSSFPEREMPQQTVRGAISPALADPQGAMSDDEYRRRSMAISRDKQRSYLDAQLAYYDNDPDKYMEIQKKRFQMDVNDDIKGRIERAMRGDGQAIGEMVNTLQKAGVFPQGEVKRNGDQVALVDPKNGKTIWQGAITPDLIQQNAALYAMAENALANDEFDKVYQIGKDRRAEGREDQKLALEGRKVAVSEGDLDNKRYATDVNAAYLKAKAMGIGGGDGTAAMSQLPAGTHVEIDPNDPDGQRQLIINTKTKQVMGVQGEDRLPHPLNPPTDAEKAVGAQLREQGWEPVTKYDATGLIKYAMQDPATGDYVFMDSPDQVFRAPKAAAIDWPTRGGAGRGNLAGAQTGNQSLGVSRAEIPVEAADAPKQAITQGTKGAEATQKEAIATPRGEADWRHNPEYRAMRQEPVASKKQDTGFQPWAKIGNWWDDNSQGRRERVAAQQAKLAPEASKTESPETSTPKLAITQGTAANRTMGDRLKDSQKEAYGDTSMYTDQQLKQINAARVRHGEEPRKASGGTPKESGFAKAVRQSREKNAAWDARTKFEKEDKERQTAIRDRRRSESAIGEAKRLKAIMDKTKPSKTSKADKKLDIDNMVIREGRSKSQQEQAEFNISNRVAWDLHEKMQNSDVDIQALTPKKLKGLFSSFGGKAEKASDYFWRTLCKELKEVDKVNATYKGRLDGMMRRAAMKPGIHKREEELRKNG